jgi:hypothetical protein
MTRETDEILQVQGFFWKQLRARGWKPIHDALSSAIFRDGRRVVVVGNQGDDSLYWTASPSVKDGQPVDPIIGYMGPEPVHVATFDIKGSPSQCRVVMNVITRGGQFAEEQFFTGPMEQAFERMFDESVRRIDDFIAGGETTN